MEINKFIQYSGLLEFDINRTGNELVISGRNLGIKSKEEHSRVVWISYSNSTMLGPDVALEIPFRELKLVIDKEPKWEDFIKSVEEFYARYGPKIKEVVPPTSIPIILSTRITPMISAVAFIMDKKVNKKTNPLMLRFKRLAEAIQESDNPLTYYKITVDGWTDVLNEAREFPFNQFPYDILDKLPSVIKAIFSLAIVVPSKGTRDTKIIEPNDLLIPESITENLTNAPEMPMRALHELIIRQIIDIRRTIQEPREQAIPPEVIRRILETPPIDPGRLSPAPPFEPNITISWNDSSTITPFPQDIDIPEDGPRASEEQRRNWLRTMRALFGMPMDER